MEPPEAPVFCRSFWGSQEVSKSRGDPRGRLRRAAERLLLPQGFPDSVSPDYGAYQAWDSLQALCSSLCSSLSARAVLEAVGVGDGSASVTGAALTWLLRDGVGIVTRIGFVWLQGSHLDCEAKQWRFVADLLNDVALVLEILAPYWLSFGPALLVMAAAARCVVGVAGGATRAALAVHQARRDNVADVAAKDSSQETLVNGAGLLLSLLLLPLLDGRPWLTWATLVLLLIGHLTFNLAAIGSLTLTSLNRPRLRLAIGWALRGGGAAGERGVACPGVGGAKLEVPRPEQVNPREPLLPGLGSRLRLHLGAPLELLASSEAELRKALECGSPDYIVVIRPSQSWVGVGLRRGAPPEASILGCAHALTLEQLLGPPMDTGTPLGRKLEPLQRKIRNCPPGAVPWGVLAETSRLFRDLGPALLRGLEAAGWDVRRPLLAVDEWRLEWAEPTAGHAPS
ncbi:RUS family member 1 isoform X5 [Zonotrichia albicollis]|uniref:RUS family member 1 isoform X5 n=1 Tax=Zonotrichia albicollis TaxID=44394 RepID=UPI003D810049